LPLEKRYPRHREHPLGAGRSDPQGHHEASEGSRGDLIDFHGIATLPATLRSRLRLLAMTFQVRLLRFARNDNFLSAILENSLRSPTEK
jgi:hypothetical protein